MEHPIKDENIGSFNAGNRNSGDRNSGDENAGNRNSGDRNSGDGNSGDRNSGGRNSGFGNSGFGNSGNRNSGFGNSGFGNSGNRNSGFFNENESTVKIFDIDTNFTYQECANTKWYNFICMLDYNLTKFIPDFYMSEEEKLKYPTYKTTGGYLRTFTYKEAWTEALKEMTEEDKEILRSIPNWNPDKFEKITGVKI